MRSALAAFALCAVARAALVPVSSARRGLSLLARTGRQGSAQLGAPEEAGGGATQSLEDYCSGAGEGLQEKQRVIANWKHYSSWYPATIIRTNSDGTMDVHYDDGFDEDHVTADAIKPAPPEEGGEPPEANKPRDDAVCETLDLIPQIKDKIAESQRNVAVWLASKRAESSKSQKGGAAKAAASDAGAGATPPYTAGSPSPAVIVPSPLASTSLSPQEDAKAKKLQELQQRLTDLDKAIANAEAEVAENDKVLQREQGKAQPEPIEPAAAKTVDDYIAEYEAAIAEREQRLRALENRRAEQEQQLASLGANPISMEDIMRNIKSLEGDLEKLRVMRQKLLDAGRLDPELKATIDSMLEDGEKLKEKVNRLADAERRAEAEKEAAEKDGNAEKAKSADNQVYQAAVDMEEELRELGDETAKLETGVHPNGAKWWRYRYEHSFAEGYIMIILILILFCFERLLKWLWRQLYMYRADAKKATEGSVGETFAVSHELDLHGTMMVHWFEYFVIQMTATVMVWLCVFLAYHVGLFDLLAEHVHGSQQFRIPITGIQYRELARGLCVVLTVGFMFYFWLIFSVVKSATHTMAMWAEMEMPQEGSEAEAAPGAVGILTMTTSTGAYSSIKEYFMDHVKHHPNLATNFAQDISKFPFWKYLRINVRQFMDNLFAFSFYMWFSIIITFFCLCLCHYYLHVGYIRVMMGFFVVQTLSLVAAVAMVWKVNRTIAQSTGGSQEGGRTLTRATTAQWREDTTDSAMKKSRAIKYFVLWMVQFTLFFLCYGASRVICQPWMWQLYPMGALIVMIITFVLATVFCFLIAPVLVSFAVSMSLPPYIDEGNMKAIDEMLKEDAETPEQYLKRHSTAGGRSP